MTNGLTLHIPMEMQLPDNNLWQHRFQVRSESSGNLYTVSQNKKNKHWACSCPGYIRYRKCKHLTNIGLPAYEIPYEPQIQSS